MQPKVLHTDLAASSAQTPDGHLGKGYCLHPEPPAPRTYHPIVLTPLRLPPSLPPVIAHQAHSWTLDLSLSNSAILTDTAPAILLQLVLGPALAAVLRHRELDTLMLAATVSQSARADGWGHKELRSGQEGRSFFSRGDLIRMASHRSPHYPLSLVLSFQPDSTFFSVTYRVHSTMDISLNPSSPAHPGGGYKVDPSA